MPIIFLPNRVVKPTLSFTGETLPPATIGVYYSQDISGQVLGGSLPYTFTEVSSTGSNIWSVSATGVISGIPGFVLRVTDSGALRTINTGAVRVT